VKAAWVDANKANRRLLVRTLFEQLWVLGDRIVAVKPAAQFAPFFRLMRGTVSRGAVDEARDGAADGAEEERGEGMKLLYLDPTSPVTAEEDAAAVGVLAHEIARDTIDACHGWEANVRTSGPDGRRILCKYSRVTACSAAPILSLRYLRSHLRALSCRDRQCGSSGWSGALLALPARLADFDEVPVWVAHVAAYLTDVVFGLGEKHGALLAPLIIARMYIGDADVHEARRFVGIGRGVE